MRDFHIREYGRILPGKPEQRSPDCICLGRKDMTHLRGLLATETSDAQAVFTLRSSAGREILQVQNHAGVIQTPYGTRIEILPKVATSCDTDSITHARSVLYQMLAHFHDLPFRQMERAALDTGRISLLEVFISHFLHEVTRLVKQGIRSDYVSCRDDLPYLRGKLLVGEHIRRNAAHRERFRVRHDEFLPDRPENRLVRSALELVRGMTRLASSQRLCREHLHLFCRVPASTSIAGDFSRCCRDRNMAHYDIPLMWCRLLLGGQSPLPRFGALDCLSLLFPMERLFEDYVAAMLKAQFGGHAVSTQLVGEYLARHRTRDVFRLRPDLSIEIDGRTVIADTKWKRVEPNRSRYGISQADLYQVYAYGRKYLHGHDAKVVWLIYPATEVFQRPLAPFHFENDFELRVVPFDFENRKILSEGLFPEE